MLSLVIARNREQGGSDFGFRVSSSENPKPETRNQELLVSVAFVDDAQIARLASQFRGCAQATDVLSFPIGENDPETGLLHLGEIVVSLETAEREARRGGGASSDLASAVTTGPGEIPGIELEILLYVVHGLLHLLGYEDHSDAGRAAMTAEQFAVLQAAGLQVDEARRGF